MNVRDPFGEGQAASEELRHALEALREDVREVVRQEVERAGLPESELERLVRETVRKEMAASRAGRTPRWPAPALLAAGIVAGLLAGAAGYRVLAGSPEQEGAGPAATEPATASAGEALGGGSPSGSVPVSAAPDPAAVAARYDSLFEARAPELAPLLSDLEDAAAAPVLDALAVWRTGEPLDPAPRRRLHDGLVQAAVNRLAGTDLVLDGLVAREPCGGASCGALLRLWEERGGEWGLPPYPAEPAGRDAALPVVERVVAIRALEADRG